MPGGKVDRMQKAFLKAMKEKFAEDPDSLTSKIHYPAPRNRAHITQLPYHTVHRRTI